MAKLFDLKAKRAEKLRAKLDVATKLRAIAEKDDGPDGPAPEDVSEADDLRAQLAQINADVSAMDVRISDIEGFIAAQAEAAEQVDAINDDAPADTIGDDGDGGDGVAEDTFRSGVAAVRKGGALALRAGVRKQRDGGRHAARDEVGFKAARFVIGLLAAKSVGMKGAANFIEDRFGDRVVARALNTAGVATGGALIPQDFSTELIELLRANTVVRGLNPRVIPMPMGNLTIPRLAAGATAGYQGELDDMAVTQESFDVLQLNAKKLTTMVSVSNDLIRRAPIGVEELVRDDMVQTMARREDLAFMLADGSGGSPVGLLNLCAPSQKLIAAPFTNPADNAAVLGQVVGVLNGMILTLRQNMSPMTRPVWIMSGVVETFLSGLRDNVGSFVFKDDIANGTLMGFPFATSQQLPTNLSTGTGAGAQNNGSYLFLADMDNVLLGETFNMSVEASDTAAYKDAGGNIVSTFQRDQSVFRIISEHDLNVRHQASLAVAVLPGWAPPGWNGFSGGAAYYVQPANTLGSAAPSTFGAQHPTGSNSPANVAAAVPGGTQPGLA